VPNNNPNGDNGWEGFGTEEPYGQQTQDAQLASGAPLASGGLASGAIAAPKRAQRQAVQQQPALGTPTIPQPPQQLPQLNPLAQLWQQVANTPGASDLVIEYAKQAAS
jgi:hypothetical protein